MKESLTALEYYVVTSFNSAHHIEYWTIAEFTLRKHRQYTGHWNNSFQ